MAHIVFARSPVAHGTITSIDVSAAEGTPGVIAVYRAEDGHDLGLAPFQGFVMMPAEVNRPIFAKDRVRFVGDIVAAVVAETREAAADAADAIVVDYDPLPAVTTAAAALAPDAPILFPDHGSNVCFATTFGDDVDALEGAEAVAEVTMVSQRLAGVPMECNALLAVPGEPNGGITCWVSHQAPHSAHAALAPTLGLEPDQLRVVCPWVGGGFGPKAAVYVEYIVTAAAARALDRPVKWAESRSEDMVSLVHGRDYVMTAKLGTTLDGTITGLDAKIVASGGAYPAIGAILPMLTQLMSPGVYDVPKVHFDAMTAITNNTTTGAYRGAGRPEATQLIERVLDVAADDLGIDPAEIRRKNFHRPDAFPLTTLTGANYDSGEYAKALDAALAAAGYDQLRADQAARRERDDSVQVGIGISSYVEVTAPIGLHMEYGAVEVHDDGSATLAVGTSVHGQGHHTAFAMVASDVLGIPMDKINFVNSDTASVPRGAGTMGSRSLQTAGSAVHVASNEVLARAKQIAANALEADVEDIVVGDGQLEVSGVPSRGVAWGELAAIATDPDRLPPGMEAAPLRHELDFDGTDSTYPFGTHIAVVEVDVDTGGVRLVRHIAVDDCGRILNPLLVAGQQHGGIAQGAAQALFEEVAYDADGNPVTSNLADYAMPSAAELPSFEASNTQTDSPRNPLGAKGIGESGTIGSTPAIQNAVVDAVSYLGVKHVDMPCTAERVWRAIQEAKASG